MFQLMMAYMQLVRIIDNFQKLFQKLFDTKNCFHNNNDYYTTNIQNYTTSSYCWLHFSIKYNLVRICIFDKYYQLIYILINISCIELLWNIHCNSLSSIFHNFHYYLNNITNCINYTDCLSNLHNLFDIFYNWMYLSYNKMNQNKKVVYLLDII